MPPAAHPRIAYLFPYAPGERDAEVYGMRSLTAAGFDVTVLDVSRLVGLAGEAPPPPRGIAVVRFASGADLAAHIAGAGYALAFDYVAGLAEPSTGAEDVLRIAARGGLPLAIVSAAALPPQQGATGLSQATRRLRMRANQALDLRRLVGGLRRRARRALPGAFPPVRASLVFAGHSPVLEEYVRRTGMDPDRVVWLNSFDYDTYVAWLRDAGGRLPPRERIAVFIDEAASNHPDFEMLGTQSMRVTPAEYSASMRRLFDTLEERTGLRVVIAAHPRADYSTSPGFFGDREMVTGRTVDLLARSSAVVGHCSTALGFAALLEKPTLLVTTREMERSGYALQVERLGTALGLSRVNIDDGGALAAIDWDVETWPRAGFAEYVRRYVRAPEAPAGLSTWEIVAAELRRFVGSRASA